MNYEIQLLCKKLDSNSGYLIIWQHQKEWQIILSISNECLHKFFFNFLYYLCKCVLMRCTCRERSEDNFQELNSLLSRQVLVQRMNSSHWPWEAGLFTWWARIMACLCEYLMFKFLNETGPWGDSSAGKVLVTQASRTWHLTLEGCGGVQLWH